jgi:flavorubredoxin
MEAGVTLIYGSMYGNTERMMNAIAQGISSTGMIPDIFDAARIHPSYILPSMWTKTGIMIGAPTYEVSLFPPVANVLDIAIHKGVRNRKVARFGSYGWSGGAQKEFEKIIENGKWDQVDSFEFRGSPTRDDLQKGVEFGKTFAQAVKGGTN